MLEVRPIHPHPMTLLLGVCQSHSKEGKIQELLHHTLEEILEGISVWSILSLHFYLLILVTISAGSWLSTRLLLCCWQNSVLSFQVRFSPLRRSSSDPSTRANQLCTDCIWGLKYRGEGLTICAHTCTDLHLHWTYTTLADAWSIRSRSQCGFLH